MAWERKRLDRAAALERLWQRDYHAIMTHSEGSLGDLVYLSIELGVFKALEATRLQRERGKIPDELLLRREFPCRAATPRRVKM